MNKCSFALSQYCHAWLIIQHNYKKQKEKKRQKLTLRFEKTEERGFSSVAAFATIEGELLVPFEDGIARAGNISATGRARTQADRYCALCYENRGI